MSDFWSHLREFVARPEVQAGLRAAAVLVGGLIVLWIARRRLRRWKAQPQTQLLVRRGVTVLILGVTVAWALGELGLSLGVVLGAAGVFTVAIGFAAQTSVSNLISGLFLMGEQPFKVGDSITVGTSTGEVLSIDMLSVKLRTPDNLLVRVPNEMVLKSPVVNLTRFAIRRLDLKISLPYEADVGAVRTLLLEQVDGVPICLQEPKPALVFLGFAESAVEVQLSAWSTKENFAELRAVVSERVKRSLAQSGIAVPYAQRRLVGASDGAPVPVRVVEAPAAVQAAS